MPTDRGRSRLRLALKVALLIGLIAVAEVWPGVSPRALPAWAAELPGYAAWARPLLRLAVLLLALDVALAVFAFLYRRRRGHRPGADDALLLGLRNVYYIVATLVALAGLIGLWGLDLRTVFTSLSIIAAAIAIVTRDFIVEIVSGLIMSFSRQLAVGDYVSLGDTRGRITTLTLMKVVLLTEDDDLVHLPNSKVFGGELVNYTRRMQRRVSIEFEVALANLSGVDAFEAELRSVLAEFADDIVADSPSLRVADLRKDAASFKFRYTLRAHRPEVERQIRKRTSRAVIDYVRGVAAGGER